MKYIFINITVHVDNDIILFIYCYQYHNNIVISINIIQTKLGTKNQLVTPR